MYLFIYMHAYTHIYQTSITLGRCEKKTVFYFDITYTCVCVDCILYFVLLRCCSNCHFTFSPIYSHINPRAFVSDIFSTDIWLLCFYLSRSLHFCDAKDLKQINYSFINDLWSYHIINVYLLETLFVNHLHIIWMQAIFIPMFSLSIERERERKKTVK